MIIVSQDKKEIINFDNVMNINVMDCNEEGYLVSAGFIVGRDDNYRELGYYKTEERAKEVLNEIILGTTIKQIAGKQLTENEFNMTMKCMEFNLYEMPLE